MEVLRTAILDMLRRRRGESFNSSEVVLQMYPEDWEHFLEEIDKEAMEMHREGLILVELMQTELNSNNCLKISPPDKV